MEILENEAMSAHTSFKAGGCAKFFAKADSVDNLVEIRKFSENNGFPLFIVGKGTNLLVSDKGFNGIIVQLGKTFSEIEDLGNGKFRVGAATPLARFARSSIAKGFAGIHKLAGIPGSIGGAIFMNAGAYGQEICETCIEVTSLDATGHMRTRSAADCKFSYRHSLFQDLSTGVANERHGEIVLSATFQLTPVACLDKTAADLECEMQECMEKRRKSQPLTTPNAGSTFKRLAFGAKDTPTQIAPGYYIEQAGLKGFRIGGAEVSQVHANFIVNSDSATAEDIKTLSEHVQRVVEEKFGVKLQREVIFLGEF